MSVQEETGLGESTEPQAGAAAEGTEQAVARAEVSPLPFPIVGIGASAGGLDALEAFFERVPAEPGVAFMVVQHLAPEHATIMPDLLAKRAHLPVQLAADGMRVEVNHAYVIPPNAMLSIQRGALGVRTPRDPERLPIDFFFRSLAEDQGPNAVAVVLSGTGLDGTAGAETVKEHGGTVLAQEPTTARFDGMPRSAIAAGIVDHVLPPEDLPARIFELTARTAPPAAAPPASRASAAVNAEALQTICTILRRNTGHDFSQYKSPTLVRRIQRRMQAVLVPAVDAYVELLRRDADESELLFHDLLIGVTHFFRDPEAFAALAGAVVPKIVRGKSPDDSVRVWVPGCSTGEEAYSIAILLRETTRRLDVAPAVKIFATDIDEAALHTARLGRYPESIAEHISEERLDRYFFRAGSGYQVEKQIREMCLFSPHDLIRDPPFSRLDLIVCRNLLIYLEQEAQQRLVPLFHYALRPGGFLFLGPSESLAGFPELFEPVDKKRRIFQRNDAVLSPPVTFTVAGAARGAVPAAALAPRPSPAGDQGIARVFERLLLDHYAPAAVIVNEQSDVVFTSGGTAKYLELPPGATSLQVVDMARKSLRPDLHTAIHEALSTGREAVREDVPVEVSGKAQRIRLAVRPLPELGASSGLLLVVFMETGHGAAGAEGAGPGGDAQNPLAEALEAELRMTKKRLQATIEELEISNEELKSANEEMLATNEELQSTNEELQTSKEELQSINEELQTVNQELNRKVDELDQVNSDLQNIFASTHIATVFLDDQLRIKKFSDSVTDVFRIIDADIGRPITDIASTLADGDLAADVRDVLATLSAKERQVSRADAGKWYIRRIRPYRTVDNVIDGVVVTFVDISELKRTQQHAINLAAIVESSQDAITGMGLDGVLTSWNAGAERLYGYCRAEALGQPVAMLRWPDGSLEAILAELRAGRQVGPFETVCSRKDGTRVPILASFFPVWDAACAVVGTAAIARDMTERKRYEAALQEADRRKDEFLALLGHELRNPLVPISNALRILRRLDPPEGKPQIQRIDRQITHMTRLIDDLLDVARITTGKVVLHRAPLDLAALVRLLVEDWQPRMAEGKVALSVALPDAPVPVIGDGTRLVQALGNLLHNGLKFTPPGGRIAVTLEREPSGQAVLRVRDTGAGMSADTLSRIFTPFTTGLSAAGGGLGLGLALANGMVELHGGTIEVESEGPGCGSTFTIRLPIADRVALDPTPPQPLAHQVRPRTILLIEDNIEVAESMAELLSLDGHAVAVEHSAAGGLASAKREAPEVVLCDIGLPGDMDGYGVARALRADPATASIFCIALSGYGQESDRRRSKEAGFDAHVTKPADPDVLPRLIAGLGAEPGGQ